MLSADAVEGALHLLELDFPLDYSQNGSLATLVVNWREYFQTIGMTSGRHPSRRQRWQPR